MTEEERQALKQRVTERIGEVKADIERLEEATKPVPPDNAIGRLTRMEAIQEKGIRESSLHGARAELSALEHALVQADSPDFGVCRKCGEPIPLKRLMLMPQSTRCVTCAGR